MEWTGRTGFTGVLDVSCEGCSFSLRAFFLVVVLRCRGSHVPLSPPSNLFFLELQLGLSRN